MGVNPAKSKGIVIAMDSKSENEQQPLQLLTLEEQYLQSHQEIKK